MAGSNRTLWRGSKSVATDDADANYIYFGVREFAMTAISNGLALHGGFIPYDATFLVFSDYARNAVRMSALMGAHAIHVYTHDSIGLGEDGPTPQPVEHLASLRHIPNNAVWRPCDAVASAVCWRAAIERRDGPSCLVDRSEEHTSELQSLMRISYAVFCLKKKKKTKHSRLIVRKQLTKIN